MQLEAGKKVYFLSDFHLGAPNYASSLEREKRIVRFLDKVSGDASAIFIVGDIFDFWYDYRSVVPKVYIRLLGKLATLSDNGVKIYFFVGNHDMWMNGYFEKEMHIPVYYEEKEFEFNGKKFLVGHGDGLGPGDHGYKFIKKIFRNPVCQWLFGIVHPTIGIGLANFLSRRSRAAAGQTDEIFLGEDNEWLITHCKEKLKEKQFDYFIYGHRHLPIDFRLNENSRYINLGDWLKYDTYAVFDGETICLKNYKE